MAVLESWAEPVPQSQPTPVENILSELPLFRRVAAAPLRKLARRAVLMRAAKDSLLYERGAPASGCYVLASGLVTLSLRSPDGALKVLRLVGPGETFGESGIFDRQPQPVDALLLADSVLVFLPAPAVRDLLEEDRSFARALPSILSQQIHALIADIEAYSLKSGAQRLAAFLHSLADPSESAPASVHLPANKTVIASRLGVTKETFSRLLHELAAQGLVEVSQRDILLRDPQRLAQLARGGAPR